MIHFFPYYCKTPYPIVSYPILSYVLICPAYFCTSKDRISRVYYNPGIITRFHSGNHPVPPRTDHSKKVKNPLAVISSRWYRVGTGIKTRYYTGIKKQNTPLISHHVVSILPQEVCATLTSHLHQILFFYSSYNKCMVIVIKLSSTFESEEMSSRLVLVLRCHRSCGKRTVDGEGKHKSW